MSRDTIEYWNDDAGPRWVKHAEALDRQLAPFTAAILDRAGPPVGGRVLDVGCGAGALSLAAAEKVGPTGRVTALDVSRTLLSLARARAARAGVAQLELIEGDAERHPLEPGAYQRIVSRFGVMFFDDTVAAFRNLRTGLAEGGSLTFACWGPPGQNPWMGLPREVTARHVDLPAPAPDAPGPFRFADADAVIEMLGRAGFRNAAAEARTGTIPLGGPGLEGAVDFLRDVGPGAAARDASPEVQQAFLEDLRETLRPLADDTGLRLGYAAWLIHAEA